MAGLKGPWRNDDCHPGVRPGSGDGEVRFATGGRTVRPPGVSTVPLGLAFPLPPVKDCSKTFGSSEKGLCTVLK